MRFPAVFMVSVVFGESGSQEQYKCGRFAVHVGLGSLGRISLYNQWLACV